MRINNLFSVLLIVLYFHSVHSQDIHYSYYQFTPTLANPAHAGAFLGSYRVNGIYSQKDLYFAGRNDYISYSFIADAPIIRGIRKQDWIGIGIGLDNSIVGNQLNPLIKDPLLNWSFFKISAAYHLALDKKQKQIISIGGQLSNANNNIENINREMTRFGILFSDLQDLDVQELRQMQGQATAVKFRDISLGLLFNNRGKKSDFKLGVAVEGIGRPAIGFPTQQGGGTGGTRPNKDIVETKQLGFNVNADYEWEFNNKVKIAPSAYFYNIGQAYALNVNSHVWYQPDLETDKTFGAGLGLRNVRDIIVYFGAKISGIKAGIAFDANINPRTKISGGLGGFEFAAGYVGTIYKKPKVKPTVCCPRL